MNNHIANVPLRSTQKHRYLDGAGGRDQRCLHRSICRLSRATPRASNVVPATTKETLRTTCWWRHNANSAGRPRSRWTSDRDFGFFKKTTTADFQSRPASGVVWSASFQHLDFRSTAKAKAVARSCCISQPPALHGAIVVVGDVTVVPLAVLDGLISTGTWCQLGDHHHGWGTIWELLWRWDYLMWFDCVLHLHGFLCTCHGQWLCQEIDFYPGN